MQLRIYPNRGRITTVEKKKLYSAPRNPVLLLDALQVMHHWSVGREYDRRENGGGKFCSHGTCSQSHNGAACSIPRTATCVLWDSDSLSTSGSSIWHIPLYNTSAREQKSQRFPEWKNLSRWSPYHFPLIFYPFTLIDSVSCQWHQ